MSDYIKREDAIQSIIAHDLVGGDARCWAEYLLENTTAADVAPVRHGRWIEKAFRIMCSDCGAEFKDEILYMIGNDEQMSYCPNCGARMDEEVD